MRGFGPARQRVILELLAGQKTMDELFGPGQIRARNVLPSMLNLVSWVKGTNLYRLTDQGILLALEIQRERQGRDHVETS